MGWQPIETMPEGRYVLVYAWHLGYPVMALRTRLSYRHGGPSVSSISSVIYGSYKSARGRNWEPTHWMELPDPPPAAEAPIRHRETYQQLEAERPRPPMDWPA